MKNIYLFYFLFKSKSLYNALYQAIFNLALTSVPVFVLSLMEQKTSIKKLLGNPQYYQTISRNSSLSAFEFTKWTLLGVWHSAIAFFLCFLFLYFNDSNLNYEGLVNFLNLFLK